MKRHGFDPLSFSFGVLFLAIAVAVAADRMTTFVSGVWLIPIAVLIVGIALPIELVETVFHPQIRLR